MALISKEARELAIAAVEMQYEMESRPLTRRIRTETNDPSVQLLLAEIVVRLGRIEKLLPTALETQTGVAEEIRDLAEALRKRV